jgi:predicted RNA-binding protein with PUA-like domain
MTRWLVKSDPDSYGFSDLERDRRTRWDGVSNALALRHLRAMTTGDDCLIYETGKVKAVVGVARVAAAAVGADGAPRVELAAVRRLAQPVALATIKADPVFTAFALVRQGRLSVMPVESPLWSRLLRLGGG